MVGRVKDLESELAETQQKLANLMKQNADQLTSQVVHRSCKLSKWLGWWVDLYTVKPPSVDVEVDNALKWIWSDWVGGRKGIRPVKNWAVGCWWLVQAAEVDVQRHQHTQHTNTLIKGNRNSQVAHSEIYWHSQAYPGCQGKEAVKRM